MYSAVQLPKVEALAPTRRSRRGLRAVFVCFLALVIVALALAGWYVSTRVLEAEGIQTITAPESAVSPNSTAAVQAAAPPASEQILVPADPELYLQVAGLGTAEDLKYLARLHRQGYKARLETTGDGGEARILIGPYSQRDTLLGDQAKLAGAGVLSIETER